MKKLASVEKFILILFVALAILLNSAVYATEVITITDTDGNNVTNSENVTTVNDTNDTEENNTIEVEENEVEDDIPDTGKNDTVLLVLIGVFAIFSIYTYSKVKKYNI